MNFTRRALALFLFLAIGITGLQPVRRHGKHQVQKPQYQHKSAAQKTINLMLEVTWDTGMSNMPEDVPPFPVFALGGDASVTNKHGLCSIAVPHEDEGHLVDLSLVICKRTEPLFEQGTTLQGLTIGKLGKCACYNLQMKKATKNNKDQYYWDIKENTELKETDTLPVDSIVVLMSTNRVARIEDGGQLISNYTTLPRIILENNVEKVERGAVKSAIESINTRQYTANKVQHTETRNGVELSRCA